MTVRSRSIPQRPPSGNLVCLLPLVLTDCTSLCVYCCSADSRIINRTKWTPVFCKPASGEHSVCCCLQLLTSIQETEDSLSSSPTQAKKKKREAAWTECIWFTSNVFYLLFWIFQKHFHCIVLACKEWNTVCLLTGLCKISWVVFIKSTIAAKESSAKEIIRHSKEKKASLLNVQI